MKGFVFASFLMICAGVTGAQQPTAGQNPDNEVQPAISAFPLTASTVTDLHLRPLFTTTIRLPEPVTSVAVGAPTLFEVEHSAEEPRLVFVKPSTKDAATSNLIIALQSGHEISLRLVSEGETGTRPVDFVVNYLPVQSFLIGSADSVIHSDEPEVKPEPKKIPVIDLALEQQANIATPAWVDTVAKKQRNPDGKAPGKPMTGALGEIRSQGDEMLVAYSVLNTTDHWIEVLPPQVELSSPNEEDTKKKEEKKHHQTLADEVAVTDCRLNATRLAPGERADGVVEFSRPGFKQGKDRLLLELATASEVDNPLLLPVPFVAPAR